MTRVSEGLRSRRAVLGGLAAMGVSAALSRSFAANARRRIDTHHHFYSPEWRRAAAQFASSAGADHGWTAAAAAAWTVEKSLADMEMGGVKSAVLSLPAVRGNWFGGDPATAVRLSRACNDYGAGLVRDYPGRFGLFASLPMIDVEASLKEIEHAFDELEVDGIGLATAYSNKWPGDPSFKPIFEELNRRRATVYFHPVTPRCCGNLVPGLSDQVLEYPEDTARAATSLLISGTLAKMKDIKWLFSHAGGTLPTLAERINSFYGGDHPAKDLVEWAPNGILAELGKLNFDVADAASPASIAALRKLVPVSQITFGSDFPFFRSAATVEGLRQLGFTPAEMRSIDYQNARRLVPRLARL